MNKSSKKLLRLFSLLVITICFPLATKADEKPNIVILFADDMGYGDLSSYGHPQIRTPNIDSLGADGIRLTSFVTGSWCVPSRTQLITGRYMPRVKFNGGTGSDGKGGLPDSEWTLAEALKDVGYRTHMVGKWHLGYKEKKFLPVNQGFETWFGLPYSNDYMKPWVQTDEPLGLYRGEKMVEHPFEQGPLTRRYTKEVQKLIQESDSKKPFLMYMAYAMPHLPLAISEQGKGQSLAGLYGDVIEELDWSVGQILKSIKEKGIEENTIVFFASDNGPWIEMPARMLQKGNEKWHAGSTGPLRGSKGQTYEGGPRVPAFFKWPAKIPQGKVSSELVGMPDVYRTFLALAGAKIPEHKLDGHDLSQFLMGITDKSPRTDYYYFRHGLEAVRKDDWKLRVTTGQPELFNMVNDPYERINRASDQVDVVKELQLAIEEMAKEVGSYVSKPKRKKRKK